jgi:hypothetical protein
MDPVFLVPETTIHANGEGSALELTAPRPQALLVTQGITSVIEQEYLSITIEGSTDGTAWIPLTTFPQKFYVGVAAMLVDLKEHPDTAYVRAHWKVGRWGRGDKTPCFRFYVFAEPVS